MERVYKNIDQRRFPFVRVSAALGIPAATECQRLYDSIDRLFSFSISTKYNLTENKISPSALGTGKKSLFLF